MYMYMYIIWNVPMFNCLCSRFSSISFVLFRSRFWEFLVFSSCRFFVFVCASPTSVRQHLVVFATVSLCSSLASETLTNRASRRTMKRCVFLCFDTDALTPSAAACFDVDLLNGLSSRERLLQPLPLNHSNILLPAEKLWGILFGFVLERIVLCWYTSLVHFSESSNWIISADQTLVLFVSCWSLILGLTEFYCVLACAWQEPGKQSFCEWSERVRGVGHTQVALSSSNADPDSV